MATQASAITFISTPGQGYRGRARLRAELFRHAAGADHHRRGLPADLPAAECLHGLRVSRPALRRARRGCLARRCFLLQRGLPPGITIYAPAIVLSTVLGWRLDLTIIFSGLLVIVYTVDRRQRGSQRHPEISDGRHLRRHGDRLYHSPDQTAGVICRSDDALTVAGGFDKMEAVDFSLDLRTSATRSGPACLGGVLSVAVLFRHRPVASAALHRRRVAARKPAGSDVQRGVQDPDAVLHPAAGRHGLCLLPVRDAAGVLQRSRRGSASGEPNTARTTAGIGAGIRHGPCARRNN